MDTSANRTSTSRGKVLIVEDERLIAEELALRVGDTGYEVTAIERYGERAVERAARDRPDAVLMDIRLAGDLDGVGAAAAIEDRGLAPVVFLTAHTDRETLARAQRSHPYGYLVKPVDGRALEPAIEMAIGRFRLEREIREREQIFRNLASLAPVGIVLTDGAGRLSFVNRHWLDLVGSTEGEALGGSWLAGVDPADQPDLDAWWRRGTAGGGGFQEIECRLLRRSGETRWARINASGLRDRDGSVSGYVGTCVDVTESRAAQAALARFHAQIRALVQRLEQAREDERTELSHLLHETIAQELAALRLGLANLRREVADRASAVAGVAELEALAGSTIDAIRKLNAALHPTGLEHLGLDEALRSQVNAFERRFRIATQLYLAPDLPRLDRDRTMVLFRAAQEALTNVAKHAEAGRVSVTVERLEAPARIRLTVDDDGRGPGVAASSPESLGLIGVSERLLHWGGTLHVTGKAPRGTRFLAELPLPSAPRTDP